MAHSLFFLGGGGSFTTVLPHMCSAFIWGNCYMHNNDNGSDATFHPPKLKFVTTYSRLGGLSDILEH